jgi:hypothetical protein
MLRPTALYLQTTFGEHPGLLVVVGTYGDRTIEWHRDKWYVKIWDWNTPHQELPDKFDSRDAAQSWAEREFLVDPATWEECDAPGSADTIVDVLKRIYPRPLTCAEAAAAARLAYAYEFIDARGRPIWPGEERCITSYNVIAGVLDALDWDRQGCSLFATNADNSYGFVADTNYWADAVESSTEFRLMWHAFIVEARVTQWISSQVQPAPRAVRIPEGGLLSTTVRALVDGERHPGYQTGAMASALGITDRSHVLLLDAETSISLNEAWTDVRTMQVAVRDDGVHVVLERRLPDGSRRSYLTSLDATLRKAVLRPEEHLPLTELSIEDERDRFAVEVEAWLAAQTTEPADDAFVLEPGDEVDGLIARIAADPAAVGEAVAFLRGKHIFVAEAMNDAPPHVVRRVVLGALEAMKGAGNDKS